MLSGKDAMQGHTTRLRVRAFACQLGCRLLEAVQRCALLCSAVVCYCSALSIALHHRYCSLDNGHALAALTTSARLLGWHAQLVDSPTAHELSTLFNLPQPPQLTSMNAAAAAPVPTPTTTTHPEPEHPDCLVALWPAAVAAGSSADVIQHAGTTAAHSSTGTVSSLLMYDLDPAAVAEAVARTEWAPATANVLSRYHYGSWAAVDQVAAATARYSRPSSQAIQVHAGQEGAQPSAIAAGAAEAVLAAASRSGKTAHAVIRGRRSAVDFDARAEMPRAVLLRLLWALTPRDADGGLVTAGMTQNWWLRCFVVEL